MLLNLESCSKPHGKYVFKALFDYEDVWKDREVTGIYLMDENTGILLCKDNRNMDSPSRQDVETFILRSEDNGKTFVRSSFGEAHRLSKLCMAADKSLYCIIQRKASDGKDGLWMSEDEGRSWKKCFPHKSAWMKSCFTTTKSVTCRRKTMNGQDCTKHQTEERRGCLFHK